MIANLALLVDRHLEKTYEIVASSILTGRGPPAGVDEFPVINPATRSVLNNLALHCEGPSTRPSLRQKRDFCVVLGDGSRQPCRAPTKDN